jgi:hypothetical protein
MTAVGRNQKLTGMCARRLGELLPQLGIRAPFVLHVPDTLPVQPAEYEAFADYFALHVLTVLTRPKTV